MTLRLLKQAQGCRDGEFEQLSIRIGHSLPEDYEEFLRKANGGTPEPNLLPLKHGDTLGVTEFLSANDVSEDKFALGQRLSANSWPIADAEGGNYVCLRLDGSRWKVTFWDHEVEREFPVADSFGEFLELLQPFQARDLLRPGQVKSVWVDPSLLEDTDD